MWCNIETFGIRAEIDNTAKKHGKPAPGGIDDSDDPWSGLGALKVSSGVSSDSPDSQRCNKTWEGGSHPAFKVIEKDTDQNYVTFRHGLFRCGTSCPITRHIIDSRNGGPAVVQVVSDRQVESEHQQYWREREWGYRRLETRVLSILSQHMIALDSYGPQNNLIWAD